MKVAEVKSIIYKTAINDYIAEGMCVSEPILTTEGPIVVDNFLLYSKDCSTLYCSFGIDAMNSQCLYISEIGAGFPGESCTAVETARRRETVNTLYSEYSDLYTCLRDFVMQPCSKEQKAILRRYCTMLNKISKQRVWEWQRYYSPRFFSWAEDQL